MSEADDQAPILEEPCEGSKKLYIIFGGIAAGIVIPPFEFIKSSNILDENRLFVRDFKQTWYHAGLPGISTNISETSAHLEAIIERYAPEETIMLGNSMGGFAAMLFASLIGNVRAVAFAPQTFIGPWKRLRVRDKRWKGRIRRTYLRTLTSEKFYDLSKLTDAKPWRADILVAKDHRLDMIHARHVADLPQVTVHEYPEGGHNLVKHLRDLGELPRILRGEISP